MFLKEMLFRYNCEGTGTEKKFKTDLHNPIMAEKEN